MTVTTENFLMITTMPWVVLEEVQRCAAQILPVVEVDQEVRELIRDVAPGEIVVINEKGLLSLQAFPEHQRRAFCIFEYVYFARPDSIMFGRSVHEFRKEFGRRLAKEHPVKADLVMVAMQVPKDGFNTAHHFTLERHPQPQHAVGRGVLWTKIKDNPVCSQPRDAHLFSAD